jgi:hypothetical protein
MLERLVSDLPVERPEFEALKAIMRGMPISLLGWDWRVVSPIPPARVPETRRHFRRIRRVLLHG